MQRSCIAVAVLSVGLAAQSTVVIPENMAGAEGNTNTTIPWNRVGTQTRVLYQNDPRNFTLQGVTYPITITEIAWRANGGVTTGPSTYPNVVIEMSTAATSWQGQSAVYAANHGPDLAQVFSGSVTASVGAGTTPNNFHANAVLATPFTYDPLSGSDLAIEVLTDGFAGFGAGVAGDLTSTGLCSRLWDLNFATSGTSSNVQPGASSALQLTYTAAPGLWPGFTSDVRTGATPLTVNFFDRSVTSDPAGVVSWAWDLDGDSVPDSNLQNPTFVYTTGGSYDVTLTVVDSIHGARNYTQVAAVVPGIVTADFEAADLSGGTFFQFTDTSAGQPDSWAWDFDSDGTVDATVQNPVYLYPTTGPYSVTLTASNSTSGFSDTVTKTDYIVAELCTQFGAGGSFLSPFAGVFFDLTVKQPAGIVVTELDIHFAALTPATIDVYLTPGGYLGNDADPTAWRKVATGTFANPSGRGVALDRVDISDFYLPQGTFGIAVYSNAGLAYSSLGSTANFENYAVSMFAGRSRSGLWGGTSYAPRVWDGCVHFAPAGTAGYGHYANGCAGSNGVPGLTGNAPRLGMPLTVNIENAAATAPLFLVLGFDNQNSPFGPLPFDLTGLGLPGCFLNTQIEDWFLLLSDTAGAANWTATVPNSMSLMSLLFYNQALVVDTSVTPGIGAVTSDASVGFIGN